MLTVTKEDPREYDKRYRESGEIIIPCSVCGLRKTRNSMKVVDRLHLCRECVKEREEQQAQVEAEHHEAAANSVDFHEVCLAFPLMDDEAFKELCDDIKANGLRNEIVTYQGKIIDGRNRYNACREVGVAPRMREWDGNGSLVAYVVSLNLRRRHLDAGQRAMLGAKLKPMFAEEAAKRQAATQAKPGERVGSKVVEKIPPPSDKGKARDEAARAVGVNPRYIDEAEKISKENPELAKRVEEGEVNIPQAKKVLEGDTIEEAKKRKPRTIAVTVETPPEAPRSELTVTVTGEQAPTPTALPISGKVPENLTKGLKDMVDNFATFVEKIKAFNAAVKKMECDEEFKLTLEEQCIILNDCKKGSAQALQDICELFEDDRRLAALKLIKAGSGRMPLFGHQFLGPYGLTKKLTRKHEPAIHPTGVDEDTPEEGGTMNSLKLVSGNPAATPGREAPDGPAGSPLSPNHD